MYLTFKKMAFSYSKGAPVVSTRRTLVASTVAEKLKIEKWTTGWVVFAGFLAGLARLVLSIIY